MGDLILPVKCISEKCSSEEGVLSIAIGFVACEHTGVLDPWALLEHCDRFVARL